MKTIDLTIQQDGEAIACLRLAWERKRGYYAGGIRVEAAYQRQQIGSALMAAAADLLKYVPEDVEAES